MVYRVNAAPPVALAGLEAWPKGTIQAEELWKMDLAEYRYIMGRAMSCPSSHTVPTGSVGAQGTVAEQHWPSHESTDRLLESSFG